MRLPMPFLLPLMLHLRLPELRQLRPMLHLKPKQMGRTIGFLQQLAHHPTLTPRHLSLLHLNQHLTPLLLLHHLKILLGPPPHQPL